MKTLHIIASPRWERSKSRHLGEFVSSKLGWEVITLDLYASEVPYITNNIIAYNYGFFDYANLSDAEKKIADVQKKYIEQLKSVDNIVVSAPLWNFGMPAILKWYIDLVVKVGETFTSSEGNMTWLLTNIKNFYIVTAKGWVYAGTAWEHIETLEANIKQAFAFMGVHNPQILRIEWINAKDEATLDSEIENIKNTLV